MKRVMACGVLLTFILQGCVKENAVSIPSINCNYDDSSGEHAKNGVYSALIEKYVQQGFPGFAMCVSGPVHGTWIGAAGYAKLETRELLKKCHLFHSASVAKMYIAVTILKLYEEGKLGLDDKARDYLPNDLPDIPNLEQVSIKHLLSHHSGIPDFTDNKKFFVDLFNNINTNNSWRNYLTKYVVGKDALFEPGSGYSYSNTDYLLLGLVVEHAANQSVGEAVHHEVLEPLGLHETYFKYLPAYPNISGIANNYFTHYDGYLENVTELQLHLADIAIGHEGVIASPRDYMRFLQKLVNGELLDSATLNMMLDFVPTGEDNEAVGLGIFYYPSQDTYLIGHEGRGPGTMTYLFYLPEENTCVFYASNLGGVFSNEMSDRFYDEILHEVVRKVRE